MKKALLFAVCVFPPLVYGEAPARDGENKSGYRYLIKNYFSKKRTQDSGWGKSRDFVLFGGLSFYREREGDAKALPAFSSFSFGFHQRMRELANFGDIGLQAEVFFSKPGPDKEDRDVILEFAPRISIPEIRTAFPFYIGSGFGLGFYPFYILKKKPFFSMSWQFFAGLRFLEIYHNIGLAGELNLRLHFPFNERKREIDFSARTGFAFRF